MLKLFPRVILADKTTELRLCGDELTSGTKVTVSVQSMEKYNVPHTDKYRIDEDNRLIARDIVVNGGEAKFSFTPFGEQRHRVYIDTGAMYRAVGLKAVRSGVDTLDAHGLEKLIKKIEIDIRYENGEQHIYLDGEDVSGKIRTPEISIAASNVSSIPAVRTEMVELQRRLAENHNVIMDGRDIGSCVLPNAELKIYLTASVDARALRRCRQLEESGTHASLEDVKRDIELRDRQDMTRAASPLVIADGARVVDTSDMSLEESVNTVINMIREYTK